MISALGNFYLQDFLNAIFHFWEHHLRLPKICINQDADQDVWVMWGDIINTRPLYIIKLSKVCRALAPIFEIAFIFLNLETGSGNAEPLCR